MTPQTPMARKALVDLGGFAAQSLALSLYSEELNVHSSQPRSAQRVQPSGSPFSSDAELSASGISEVDYKLFGKPRMTKRAS